MISLVSLVVVLCLAALVLWAVRYLQLPDPVYKVAVVIVVVILVVWLIGLLTGRPFIVVD